MARDPLRFQPVPGDPPRRPWRPGDPRPRPLTPEDYQSVAAPEDGLRRTTREGAHG